MSSDVGRAGDAPVNPWRAVWFRPQAAIKAVLARGQTGHVLLLALLGGMAGIFGYAGEGYVLGRFSTPVLLFLVVVGGAVAGIISLYFNAAILGWFGCLLGGRAPMRDLRAAFAWSQFPSIASLVIVMAAILAFGIAAPDSVGMQERQAIAAAVSITLGVFNLWALALLVRMVGAAEGFGIARSLLAVIGGGVVIPLLLAVLVRALVFQPFTIPAASMAPTLIPGDYVFANKFAYGYSRYSSPVDLGFEGRLFGAEPRRGDLVIFRLPRDARIDYVKRLVGLPGDRIQMIGGVLHINGAAVERQRIDDFLMNEDGWERRMPRYRETLPDGASFETIDLVQNGEADDTHMFTVPEGHYFMLGDNRDNSTDSRFLGVGGVGFVPRDNLIGRISLRFFSKQEGGTGIRWDRVLQIPR